MLIKECAAQTTVAHMTNVQKGSLIQALLYDDERDKYTYLLAKVEHTDFVDDSDFSFKSGFSKDMKKLWKSCIFEIDDLNASIFQAKVYSNNVAKYWYDKDILTEDDLEEIFCNDEILAEMKKTIRRSEKIYLSIQVNVI